MELACSVGDKGRILAEVLHPSLAIASAWGSLEGVGESLSCRMSEDFPDSLLHNRSFLSARS